MKAASLRMPSFRCGGPSLPFLRGASAGTHDHNPGSRADSLIWPSAAGRRSGALSVTIDDLDTGSYPDMKVLVTVRDANGFVPDLGIDSFELIEDGRCLSNRLKSPPR